MILDHLSDKLPNEIIILVLKHYFDSMEIDKEEVNKGNMYELLSIFNVCINFKELIFEALKITSNIKVKSFYTILYMTNYRFHNKYFLDIPRSIKFYVETKNASGSNENTNKTTVNITNDYTIFECVYKAKHLIFNFEKYKINSISFNKNASKIHIIFEHDNNRYIVNIKDIILSVLDKIQPMSYMEHTTKINNKYKAEHIFIEWSKKRNIKY